VEWNQMKLWGDAGMATLKEFRDEIFGLGCVRQGPQASSCTAAFQRSPCGYGPKEATPVITYGHTPTRIWVRTRCLISFSGRTRNQARQQVRQRGAPTEMFLNTSTMVATSNAGS